MAGSASRCSNCEAKIQRATSFGGFTSSLRLAHKGARTLIRDSLLDDLCSLDAEGACALPRHFSTGSYDFGHLPALGTATSDAKLAEDFRAGFLRKLSQEKVWLPAAQRMPKQQTVIIFDWDDTLLCTGFLNRHSDRPMHVNVLDSLKNIEQSVVRLLERALQSGHTFIITNALDGWVEYSAAKYIPGVLPVLHKVRILSARSRYEAMYPREVGKWKTSMFIDLQRELDLPVVTNLNSFGDSNYEMAATVTMGEEFQEAYTKTVKFQEHPLPEELLRQLELVEKNFESVVFNARSSKVSLERKKKALPSHGIAC